MKCYIKKKKTNSNKIYFDDEKKALFIRKKSPSATKGSKIQYVSEYVEAKNVSDLENKYILETLIEILDQKHELIFERNNNLSKQSCKLKKDGEKLIFSNKRKNKYGEDILESCSKQNNKIYTTLLWELIHYFYYTNRGSSTTAFLHLYRIVEYLTFAAPIIYMKKSLSFINAYNSMRSLFTDNQGKGEIAFFKDFLNKTINFEQNVTNEQGKRIDKNAEQSSDIELDEETAKKLREGLKNLLGNQDLIACNVDSTTLSIKCFDIVDSFITLRNKTFHDKIDYKNKVNKEILFDEIFGVLNRIYINWIEYILSYVINEDYKMHNPNYKA